jgi:hypothetical protein
MLWKREIYVQILCFWTLSIVLSLSKNNVLFIFQNNMLETGFCLCLQVEPSQLGPIDRATPYLQTPLPTPDMVYKPSTVQTICKSPENIKLLKILHVWGLAPENCHDRNRHWRKEILLMLLLLGVEPWFFGCAVWRLVTVHTELFWFLYNLNYVILCLWIFSDIIGVVDDVWTGHLWIQVRSFALWAIL